jgi:primosomal protein N' (replication factor Y)
MPHTDLIEVVVALPLDKTFTYRLPPAYIDTVQVGMRVLVPFGKRKLTGYVVGLGTASPCEEIKDIEDVIDAEPLFSPQDLSFYQWTSQYYFYPLGQTISEALPQGINSTYQQIVSLAEKGKMLLGDNSLTELQRSILNALAEEKAIPCKKLEKTVGRYNLYNSLHHLCERGGITLAWKKTRHGTRPKTEQWFSAHSPEAHPLLKGKQKEIYQILSGKGSLPLRAITAAFGNCSAALQALLKKSLICCVEREALRMPASADEIFPEPVHVITDDQQAIIKQLRTGIEGKTFFPFLLHGVTGSGKTEIYLQIMEEVLRRGRQCLLLVPEIALTVQLWDRVISRINAPAAMLHSNLTSAERFDSWRMIRRGEIKIVIGARSAVFASFADLGVIIVDEEHDSSYKQDAKLRYSARDLSLIKGKFSSAVVVLGSATPSLESTHNTVQKKYHRGLLAKRIEDRQLPAIKIIDMRIAQELKKGGQHIISPALQESIARHLQNGQQCLLFLNRRGYAPVVICQQCGYTFRCPNCDVSLIHHHREQKLRCHYCDSIMPQPESCPQCHSYFLEPLGWGTERLEKDILQLFPKARVARMDRDTTTSRGAARNLLKHLYKGDIDILIGTQMIAKGHHLPQVTLVGVVCADHSLNFPDFRASEHTFQLLTQVSGRAGRGDVPGEVIIQTYNPEHYSIRCAQRHDYQRFFEIEMNHRKELGYPPYARMINIRLEGASKEKLIKCAADLGATSKNFLSQLKGKSPVEMLGPAPAPWGKLKGKYRYHMLLKSQDINSLRRLAAQIINHARTVLHGKGISLAVDVDPVFVL